MKQAEECFEIFGATTVAIQLIHFSFMKPMSPGCEFRVWETLNAAMIITIVVCFLTVISFRLGRRLFHQ